MPLSRRQRLIMAVGGALFGSTPARSQSKVHEIHEIHEIHFFST
jgi:hypothetical protein